MRRHAKASSAGSTEGNGNSRGLFGRAFATRGAFSDSKGSGAPKAKLALAFGGALALILVLGVTLASAVVPTVTIEDAKEVSYTSALAKGTVDPQGKETNCHFEYVSQAQLDENIGNGFGEFEFAGGADCNGNPHEGSGAQNVEAQLTGLSPSTVYHLRLVASNEDGQSEAVAASTFETEAVAKPTVTVDPVTTFTGTTAHFTGQVNPNAPGGNPDAFKVSWHFQCTPECPGPLNGTLAAGNTAQPVQADAAGLEPNTLYEVSLVAENAGGSESDGPVSFTTAAVGPDATTIPAFVLEGGHNALVGGRVNAHNSATTYWVEYGTDTNYGTSEPASKDAAAGSSGQDKVVTQEISGLSLNTTYHYRLIAKNVKGEVKGEDMTFTTPVAQPAESCPNAQFRTGPSAALPDCRAYELASEPELGSAARSLQYGGVTPYSLVAADGDAVVWNTDAVAPGVDGPGRYQTYVSRRTAGGWTSQMISPPGSKTLSLSAPSSLMGADPNLDRFLWETLGVDLDPTHPVDPLHPDQFAALYREEPDGSFVRISQGSQSPPGGEGGGLRGFSSDLLKVAFRELRQIEPGATLNSTYLRSGNTTQIISRDENNVPVEISSSLGLDSEILSEDGSAVAFTNSLIDQDVWLRDLDAGHSILVANGASIVALSAKGTRLLLRTSAQLTPDDEDSSSDLYEYNADTEALTRLSAPSGAPAGPGPGNGAAGFDQVAVSKDGSTVYFASAEQLDGAKGTSGKPNLYVHKAGGTHFVATLAPGDPVFGQAQSGGQSGLIVNHVRFTPDGSKLLFESRARLTSYDNAGHVEIYEHDPATGALLCTSCRPDGASPKGEASLRDIDGSGGSTLEFSQVPLNPVNADKTGSRVFFQSSDSILPQDTNGKYDIYEFDLATGTTSLISTGKSPSDSAYLGNSTDGRDVFFFSTDSLTPGDHSIGSFKAYDARTGGGFTQAVKPAPCEGEACRGTTSSKPADAPPATPNFIGPGNPKPKHAKKHKAKKHAKHKSHKKQQSKSHKRAANANGRTGR